MEENHREAVDSRGRLVERLDFFYQSTVKIRCVRLKVGKECEAQLFNPSMSGGGP